MFCTILTFYLLEEENSDGNVSLIYEKIYDNSAMPYCDESWKGKENAYLCKGDGLTSKLNEIRKAWGTYVVTVTIPTAYQIANAADYPEWQRGEIYNLPSWLSDDDDAYWTSTIAYDEYIWFVSGSNLLGTGYPDSKNYIRPVIIISKDEL